MKSRKAPNRKIELVSHGLKIAFVTFPSALFLTSTFHMQQWKEVIQSFKPPIYESRYALLAAAKPNGNAIGVTELCVAPSPIASEMANVMGLRKPEDSADMLAPYLSNLAGTFLHSWQGGTPVIPKANY
jgi:hypothetical protein